MIVEAALLQTPQPPGGMRPMMPGPGQPQLHPEGNGQPGAMAGPSQFVPGGPGQFGPGGQPRPPFHGPQQQSVVQQPKGENTEVTTTVTTVVKQGENTQITTTSDAAT